MLEHNRICSKPQRGFSLVEVLIAVVVLSFGLLAIGTFQAKLLNESGYSKARAEAIALAQEKLDALRDYSTPHDLAGNLINAPVRHPALGAEYTYPDVVPETLENYNTDPSSGELDTIVGTNASFSRQWDIIRSGNLSTAYVTVSWTNTKGETQEVKLESDLAWRNPRGTSDIGEISEPLIDSPTGKAYLGDGSLTKDDMDAKVNGKTGTTDNNDGTLTADYDGDGDLELIVVQDDGSGEVALTLPDACKVDGGCTDFVKISGTVFFDKASSRLGAEEVYVLASDAAYCARWKPVSTNPTKLSTSTDLSTLPGTDDKVFRNNDPDEDFTGNKDGKSDYDYFNYTCYIGGGWYGNIGLAMTGANVNRTDFACVGDPENTTDLRWKRVELAKRRVYRGMLHKYLRVGDVNEEVKDLDGETIFYTRGIKDAAALPDINWPERYQGHDFIVANGNNATRESCLTVLSRPDTKVDGLTDTVNLFSNMSGDFICLNADNNNGTGTGDMLPFKGYPWNYLNTFDTSIYDARLDCPYDPSDPPSTRYTIAGSILFDGTPPSDISLWGSSDPTSGLYEGNVNTSDGFGNCEVTGLSGDVLNFTCDYYVWKDSDGVETPWTGNVIVNSPITTVCAPSYDTSVFNWESVYAYTDGITGFDVPASFICSNLQDYTIAGKITVDPGNDLTSGTLAVSADNETDNVGCQISVSAESASYSCNVLELSKNKGYTGTVTITLPDGFNCDSVTLDPSVTATSTCSGNAVTLSFRDMQADSSINNISVLGPMEQVIFTGKVINNYAGQELVTKIGVFADNDATCTVSTVDPTDLTSDVVYSCQTLLTKPTVSWTGTVTVTPPDGFVCDPGSVSGTVSDGGTLPDITCDEAIASPVYLDVLVKDNVTPSTVSDYYITGVRTLKDALGNEIPNPCDWVWAESNASTRFICKIPMSTYGETWSGSLYIEPRIGYKLCPTDTLTYSGLQQGETYNETIITVRETDACP